MKQFAALLLLALPACASITQGSTQEIAVETTPTGAHCSLTRQGQSLGKIESTPGTLLIEKTKHDLSISCAKSGYGTAIYQNHSGSSVGTFGNIIIGGGIGWAIDSARGADNEYTTPVVMQLPKSGTTHYKSPETPPPSGERSTQQH